MALTTGTRNIEYDSSAVRSAAHPFFYSFSMHVCPWFCVIDFPHTCVPSFHSESRGPFLSLPGVPGMALGTLGDHLCAGTPEKVDFSCLWGPCRSPLGDPAGTLFRLWTPPGPSRRAFGSDLLALLMPPGFDPVFRAPKR